MTMLKAHIRAFIVFLTMFVLAGAAAAQEKLGAPGYIDYQGVVFEQNGQPPGSSNPHYSMLFRIYDEQEGGNLIWSERQTVTVHQGRFSVRLGTGIRITGEDKLTGAEIKDAFGGAERYLEVTVIDHGKTDGEPIQPRLAFQSAPFSFVSQLAVHAERASSAAVADTVSSEDVALLGRDGQEFTGTNYFAEAVGIGHKNDSIGLHVQDPGGEGGHIQVGVRTQGAERKMISFGDGDLVYIGEMGQDNRMELRASQFAMTGGNVGIGTGDAYPSAKLEVRGDIKLGQSGELYAAASSENLRIVSGHVNYDANNVHGAGWRATRVSQGVFRVDFDTPFWGYFNVVASSRTASGGDADYVVSIHETTTTHFTAHVRQLDGNYWDQSFMFIAIGSRR